VKAASALLAALATISVAHAQGSLLPPWMSGVTPPPERELPHDTHPADPGTLSWDPDQALVAAAAQATPGPRRVLDTARSMIDDSTIVRGSCFDWVDAVYHRAGGHSHDTFHGGQSGPYAQVSDLQPGDWTFFINHSWGDDTHSAIFINWIDQSSREAQMVSYAGGHRDEPGRFGDYELTSVFRVVRMEDAPPAPARTSTHRSARGRGRDAGTH
jgi:hypothetical protein